MDVMALDVGSRKHAVAVSDARLASCTEVANEVEALRRQFVALASKSSDCWVVMEATGVYHWQAAVLAHAAGLKVAVLNPKVTSNFAKALGQRNKTDAVDAQVLLRYAQVVPLVRWQPPRRAVIELRAISRHLLVLTQQQSATKNRLHAEEAMGESPSFVLRAYRQEIKRLEGQIATASTEAMKVIRSDADLMAQFESLDSMCGVAQASAIALLGEMAALPQDMKARACVAHAGLDVRQHESGTSVSKPGRLTKHGNRHLRRALYMPAMSAIQRDPHAKAFYERLQQRGKKPKQALCAVMRKMLMGAWVLMKSRGTYDGARLYAQLPAAT
jgi:transposase